MRFVVFILNVILLATVIILTWYKGMHVVDILDLILYAVLFLAPSVTMIYLLTKEKRVDRSDRYHVRKKASTDHPIHELLQGRWSPYAFDNRLVTKADLLSLFEAARWAPSSYNEQPWRYIVAAKDDSEEFERLLSCLVEGNQIWAKSAPVLALGIVSLKFAQNAKENRAAVHDLGLAAGNLVTEASARGLSVHQMIGILPDKAREVYGIPEGFEAWTALAIGYAGDPENFPSKMRERDLAPRQRKPLAEFVFTKKWSEPFKI